MKYCCVFLSILFTTSHAYAGAGMGNAMGGMGMAIITYLLIGLLSCCCFIYSSLNKTMKDQPDRQKIIRNSILTVSISLIAGFLSYAISRYDIGSDSIATIIGSSIISTISGTFAFWSLIKIINGSESHTRVNYFILYVLAIALFACAYFGLAIIVAYISAN